VAMLQCRVDAAMPARNAMSQRCNGMDETGVGDAYITRDPLS